MRAAKESRMRQSRGSKALEAAKVSAHENAINTDDIIKQHTSRKRPNRSTTPVTPDISKIAINSAFKSRDIEDMANSRTNTPSLLIKTPEAINALQIPKNIENGSLVVLTVNDPSSPAKKMLQTYIANGPGKLTPVDLPPNILNYVVGYMKKGTPKGSNLSSSPQLMSPSSVTSIESHNSAPSVSVLPNPAKRQRHSSYTITQL
uniref:Uncharacterized protein n=1 Tax=Pararge aegeria TaxID=116150 RepID=S4PX87_9NEOP